MSELNFNKIILKTAMITVIVLFVVFSILIGSLTIFYPSSLARATSSLGLDKLSIFYYELSYQKTQDVNDLYNLLNKTIIVKDNQKIVENFELLFDDGSESYYDFIDYVNDYHLNSIDSYALMLYLANEDARLKQSYVEALYNLNEKDKAFSFAAGDLLNESFASINDYNRLNFIMVRMFSLLNIENAPNDAFEQFNSYTNGELINFNFFDSTLSYYNDIKEIYDLSFYLNEGSIDSSFKLCVTANHLAVVASTLVQIAQKTSLAIDTTNLLGDIQMYLVQINQLEQIFSE